jgi:DNA-binding NarL/FixJ family response regulator
LRWNIHNVLVIAEKEIFGACLGEVLREHGCDVTVVESYNEWSEVSRNTPAETLELVIATNTSLPPSLIRSTVPDIKAQHPGAPLIVLSGYCADDFVADLLQNGADRFLPLPFEQDALLAEVDGLLSLPTP